MLAAFVASVFPCQLHNIKIEFGSGFWLLLLLLQVSTITHCLAATVVFFHHHHRLHFLSLRITRLPCVCHAVIA